MKLSWKGLRLWWAAVLLAAASGCATRGRVLSPQFRNRAGGAVVVLPFDNESVDLVASEMLRKMAVERLEEFGYAVADCEEVDSDLLAIGITDGGQLRAVTPRQAGEAVRAEGLFYGVVEEFAFLNVGFAVRRVVRLRMRYVLASTGEVLWEDAGQGLTERLTLRKRDAGRAFMEGLLERAIEGIFRTPLMPEARAAVHALFWRLPPYYPQLGRQPQAPAAP